MDPVIAFQDLLATFDEPLNKLEEYLFSKPCLGAQLSKWGGDDFFDESSVSDSASSDHEIIDERRNLTSGVFDGDGVAKPLVGISDRGDFAIGMRREVEGAFGGSDADADAANAEEGAKDNFIVGGSETSESTPPSIFGVEEDDTAEFDLFSSDTFSILQAGDDDEHSTPAIDGHDTEVCLANCGQYQTPTEPLNMDSDHDVVKYICQIEFDNTECCSVRRSSAQILSPGLRRFVRAVTTAADEVAELLGFERY